MKVYELMKLLGECEAGAEVCYCDLVTLDEVKKHFAQEDGGERFYEMRGDILGLNEINSEGKETGRCTLVEVVYILQNYMLQDGYVVLGIKPFPTVDNALSTTTISNYERISQRVNDYLDNRIRRKEK